MASPTPSHSADLQGADRVSRASHSADPTSGFRSTILAEVQEVYASQRDHNNTDRQIAAIHAIEERLAETLNLEYCCEIYERIWKQFQSYNDSVKPKKKQLNAWQCAEVRHLLDNAKARAEERIQQNGQEAISDPPHKELDLNAMD